MYGSIVLIYKSLWVKVSAKCLNVKRKKRKKYTKCHDFLFKFFGHNRL